MAYSTISKAKSFFNTIQYSGTGSAATVTGVGFKPDLFWIKQRNSNQGHLIWDGIRGGNYYFPTASNAQSNADVGTFTAASDGYSLNTDPAYNGSGSTYVGYNWLMGGATPSQTYKVVVVSDSGNKFRFRNSADNATFGESAVTLDLQEGGTYTFDGSDSTNSSHPFVLGTSSGVDGSYSTGVTYKLDGVTKTYSQYTSGYSSATSRQLIITVAASAPTLYYNCSVHSGMGGAINTNSTHGSSDFGGSAQSLVCANTTTGCSIVKYSGTGSSQTIGHGLGVAPDMMWIRRLDGTEDWAVYHSGHGGAGYYQALNTTEARSSNNNRFSSVPTSSSFTVNSHSAVNHSGGTHIAYCFANKPGFVRASTYMGNGSTDGPMVYTGFKPSFVMYKGMLGGNAVDHWEIQDNARHTNSPGNPQDESLYPNLNSAEGQDVTDRMDFYANGFKMRTNGVDYNGDGQTYLYMAFGQTMVGSNNIPSNAF